MRDRTTLLQRDANYLPVLAALYAALNNYLEFHNPNIGYPRLVLLPILLVSLHLVALVGSRRRRLAAWLDGATVAGLWFLLLANLPTLRIFWIGDPALFALHSLLMALLLLATRLLRRPLWSAGAACLIAVGVLALQLDRPEFGFAYAAAPWALVVLWSWSRLRAGTASRPSRLVLAALAVCLSLLPLKTGRYVPLTRERLRAIQSQPGVEVLFLNRAGEPVPLHRKEVLCDPGTGALVVTPHDGSRTIAVIGPEGGMQSLELPTEACDNSFLDGRTLYTGLDGDLIGVDLGEPRIVSRLPLCDGRIYYLDPGPAGNQLSVSCGGYRYQCFVLRREGPGWAAAAGPYTGEHCVLAGGDRYLISWYEKESMIGLLDLRTGRLVSRVDLQWYTWLFGVFHQLTVDHARGRFFFAAMFPGEIQVYDLGTLERLGSFRAGIGVRGVLVDERDPGRVYSWNYATGAIHEHALPGGAISRSWDVGPVVRKINWDCDGESLLVASSQGGFRIRLETGR